MLFCFTPFGVFFILLDGSNREKWETFACLFFLSFFTWKGHGQLGSQQRERANVFFDTSLMAFSVNKIDCVDLGGWLARLHTMFRPLLILWVDYRCSAPPYLFFNDQCTRFAKISLNLENCLCYVFCYCPTQFSSGFVLHLFYRSFINVVCYFDRLPIFITPFINVAFSISLYNSLCF